ncbi:MAG: PilN domain-containing protein [Phycisphaerae bacterium]
MEEIDFLPDRIKAQRARRHRLSIQAYLMAICVGLLMTLAYVFHVRVRTAQGELAMLEGRGDAMNQQLAMKESLERELGDLMIKQRIEEQLGRRVGTLAVLAELQRAMPESMTLTKLNMETVEVAVPVEPAGGNRSNRPLAVEKSRSQVVKRVRLTLTGMAPTDVDVANFIGQLAGSKLFENVNMGYARNVTFRSRSARQFQVSCYVIR